MLDRHLYLGLGLLLLVATTNWPARPKRPIRAIPSRAAGITPASRFSRRNLTHPRPREVHRSRERTAMTAQANPSPIDGDDAIGLSRNGRLGALGSLPGHLVCDLRRLLRGGSSL